MQKIEKVKISLIITVYNRIHLLRKGLISLYNQSVYPDELIISDDGSSENIIEGISDIIKNFSFPVKYVSQPNKGFRLAKVRNNGVKISDGDLLIFLDQDIIYTKDYLKIFTKNKNEKLFLTSYPIRLDEIQSEKITEEKIKDYDFLKFIGSKQTIKIKKQYFRDLASYIGLKLGFVKQKPKLRGGVCAINRSDYFLVNGYDEMFTGWGNEDDDIRKRLYKAGIKGFNPFYKNFPLHLYHEPFHKDGERLNKKYLETKNKNIDKDNYYCKVGINNELTEELHIVTL